MAALSHFKTKVTVSDADMLRSHITGQPFLHTWNCTAIASMQPATPSVLMKSSDRVIDNALYPHVIAFFGSSPAWSKPLHIAIAEAQKSRLSGWVSAPVPTLHRVFHRSAPCDTFLYCNYSISAARVTAGSGAVSCTRQHGTRVPPQPERSAVPAPRRRFQQQLRAASFQCSSPLDGRGASVSYRLRAAIIRVCVCRGVTL